MRRKPEKRPRPGFVLDCSVTMSWFFKDEANPYANLVRKALGKDTAVVPVLWPLEVANSLLVAERRNRASEADATKWLGYLQRLPIQIDAETATRAWSDLIQVARRHRLSAYDAAYVELALRLGLPLATLDDYLRNAAQAVGVPEFAP